MLTRETDLLPAWRQPDGVVGRPGLTLTVHSPTPMVPSTRHVTTDDADDVARHELAARPIGSHDGPRATTPARIFPAACDTSKGEKKEEDLCVYLRNRGLSGASYRSAAASLSLAVRATQRHVGGFIPRMRRARAQPVDRSTPTRG